MVSHIWADIAQKRRETRPKAHAVSAWIRGDDLGALLRAPPHDALPLINRAGVGDDDRTRIPANSAIGFHRERLVRCAHETRAAAPLSDILTTAQANESSAVKRNHFEQRF